MNAPREMHSANDVQTPRLHRLAAILVVTLLVICALVYVIFASWRHGLPHASIVRQPPTPRLQPYPQIDLRTERAQQRQRIETWAWVDRKAGIARIPIERAMALLASGARPIGQPAAGQRQGKRDAPSKPHSESRP